jgi:hypothetical protein
MSSDKEQNDQQEQQTPKSRIKTRDQIQREAGAVPARRATPASILAYVAIVVTLFVFWAVVPGYPPIDFDGQLAVSVFLRLLVIFLLMNRSAIGWIIALLIEGIYIIVFSIQIAQVGPETAAKLWGLLFISIAAMALILTRSTRQHVFSPDPEVISQQGEHPDQAEPSSSESRSSSST